jgi:uncharacterized protein YyaL (SSP411 family)
MDAVHLITGSGGWPLNVFALPDGRPFYGGTYFRKDDWTELLEKIIRIYGENPVSITDYAEKLVQGVSELNDVAVTGKERLSNNGFLQDALVRLEKHFDLTNGGIGKAPKFPMPVILKFILRYGQHTEKQNLTDFIKLTLSRIADGGIYDHLGFGFSRYTVDKEWKIPHFEKMLTDNAQLLDLFALSYLYTSNDKFLSTVNQLYGFLNEYMLTPSVGYASSIDADSEGEEGAYYTWTFDEAEKICGGDISLFSEYFNLRKEGNWENSRNILHKSLNARSYSEEEIDRVEQCRVKMLDARSKRIAPVTDPKVIASWNALLLSAFANAYRYTGDQRFLTSAKDLANYICRVHLAGDGTVFRIIRENEDPVQGMLDDYSYLMLAFVHLHMPILPVAGPRKQKALRRKHVNCFTTHLRAIVTIRQKALN